MDAAKTLAYNIVLLCIISSNVIGFFGILLHFGFVFIGGYFFREKYNLEHYFSCQFFFKCCLEGKFLLKTMWDIGCFLSQTWQISVSLKQFTFSLFPFKIFNSASVISQVTYFLNKDQS